MIEISGIDSKIRVYLPRVRMNNIIPWVYTINEEMTEEEYQLVRKIRQVQARLDINYDTKVDMVLLLMQEYKAMPKDG